MLENVIAVFKHFHEFNASLTTGLLIMFRFLGFSIAAPIFSRKDFPMLVKLGFSIILTIIFLGTMNHTAPPKGNVLYLSIVLNVVAGAMIGFVATLIYETITAAGDMINMQMGLNAGMIFDPNTREQTTIMGKLTQYIGLMIFINIGGIYWLLNALKKSFDVFPVYGASIPLDKLINIKYITHLSGNILFIGIQLAAPVLIATLAMDVILGIISKIAPQINVFQLSFLFKPAIGVAILIIILPLFINIINDYYNSYAAIF